MDLNNPVIQLCMEGTRAEFEHRIEDARILYEHAWAGAMMITMPASLRTTWRAFRVRLKSPCIGINWR